SPPTTPPSTASSTPPSNPLASSPTPKSSRSSQLLPLGNEVDEKESVILSGAVRPFFRARFLCTGLRSRRISASDSRTRAQSIRHSHHHASVKAALLYAILLVMPVRIAGSHPHRTLNAAHAQQATRLADHPQARAALDWLQSNVSAITETQAKLTEV